MTTIIMRTMHLMQKNYTRLPFISNRYSTSIPPPRKMSNIVWIDMEMTGLDIKRDLILEVACIVTDKDLNILAEGPNVVIHQPDNVLNSMNEWCIENHAKSGLTEQSRQSKHTVADAEAQILTFLENYTKKKESPLAGNTIYMDRMFIREHMPILDDFLHYRIIDVSSVKEICKRWNTKVFSNAPRKKLVHRGLDDIRESIEELKYYKTSFCVTVL